VQAKYPEAAGFIRRITDNGGRVLHDIDAIALSPQLLSSAAGTPAGPFSHIIFHHPHVGTEDLHRHRALLGHFFHRAADPSLLRERGVVHVSLGGQQPVNWQVEEQAARHGLCVLLTTVRTTLQTAWVVSCHMRAAHAMRITQFVLQQQATQQQQSISDATALYTGSWAIHAHWVSRAHVKSKTNLCATFQRPCLSAGMLAHCSRQPRFDHNMTLA
jgi:hypothetical protein